LVPPTMPGDAELNAIPVVSLDDSLPEEELQRTIRQVPGPGTSRALEAAIQARMKRSRGEGDGEDSTRAGAALEATLQGDKMGQRGVPITILAPLMLLLALLFALFLIVDLQREPDLGTSSSAGDEPTSEPHGEAAATPSAPDGAKFPAKPPSRPAADKVVPAVAPEMIEGCPEDMVKVSREGREEGETASWCVERYEYPGKGQTPRTGVSLAEAAMLCEARGGRRLCTREEWRWGCGGRYPYGRAYDPDACGTLGADQKPRDTMPAGSYPRCGSSWGIYDLVGNVAEWTAGGLIQGGSAGLDGERATCNYAVPGTKPRADIGFRCCQVAETSQGEP
ncbi:MAG: SUMF1/EgtB/PvdO family nonheme iron enzyme, partial [Myxococcota bacterium]|nr:SUMF1/EgtB/PvdO family nonheme iron enzyme [Myxococcota bacterium]